VIPPDTSPGQPAPQPAPVRYLHGEPVTAVALDYGGYAVTFAVSQPGRAPKSRPARRLRACRRGIAGRTQVPGGRPA
jgi:hypothetical protein